MRRVLATATLLACTLAGAACGDDEESDRAQAAKVIEITIADGTVSPNGERVSVRVGQRVDLIVKSDSAGEIHVHSSPEQEFSYSEGTTTLPMTIDKAGVVDVECHDLEQIIVQLEVE